MIFYKANHGITTIEIYSDANAVSNSSDKLFFCIFEFQIDGPAMDLSLRSLATDISQRVVQYYRDNKTSRFENGTRNLDWRRHFFCSLYQELSWEKLQFFLKLASEKEKEKERKKRGRGWNFANIYGTLL